MKKSISALSMMTLLSASVSAAIQVNVSPSTLTTYEGGSAATYQVVLDESPSVGETVTITPSSDDVTEGTVSGPLTFTTSNWSVPQTVTLTPGFNGDGNDGDVMFNINNSVSASGGSSSYSSAVSPIVTATNRNIDGVAVIRMDPASGSAFFINEGSSQTVTIEASFDVTPSSDIVIGLSLASSEATLSTTSVTLTSANSYTATFDVSAVADSLVDSDQPFTIVTAPSVSADFSFNGIDLNDIDGIAVNVDVPPSISSSVIEW